MGFMSILHHGFTRVSFCFLYMVSNLFIRGNLLVSRNCVEGLGSNVLIEDKQFLLNKARSDFFV
jgi:hypothetical protein